MVAKAHANTSPFKWNRWYFSGSWLFFLLLWCPQGRHSWTICATCCGFRSPALTSYSKQSTDPSRSPSGFRSARPYTVATSCPGGQDLEKKKQNQVRDQDVQSFLTCWSLNHAHILAWLISKRSGCLTIGSVRLQVGCSQQPSVGLWGTCVTGIS